MRAMFLSRENNKDKKKFQKPNILRKKTKAPVVRPNIFVTYESPRLVSSDNVNETGTQEQLEFCVLETEINTSENNITNECRSQNDIGFRIINTNSLNNNEENITQNTFNVESFLNGASKQKTSKGEIEFEVDNSEQDDWTIDLINSSYEVIIENNDETHLENICAKPETVINIPLSVATIADAEISTESVSTDVPGQNLSLEYLANGTMNFKCDVPKCNRRFRSEVKLQKHKDSAHSPAGAAKVTRPTVLQCPVKQDTDGGASCLRTFQLRGDLVKHLNEDHSPQDALYVCLKCGRRFFWSSGLRAHGRAHCGPASAPLVCAWPGCGRVFRQPCRLREHQRAHTGDKPYPCRYPNCGWSFRSASKLVRHARRHTGERRHTCAACGRAFLRREHLRDHCATHRRDKQRCTRPGCHRSFTNVNALLTHMGKAHKEPVVPASSTQADIPAEITNEEMLTVSLSSPSLAAEATIGEVGVSSMSVAASEACVDALEAEWRAARTHCPWPLPQRAQHAPEEDNKRQFVIKEEVQVELSEGSESNIYTIRSDLFLHGNILTNEDSEQMAVTSSVDGGVSSLLVLPPPDGDLSLLDADPTVGLMQEELMYTDAAVDESTFRVFLMSGEELG